MGRERQKKKNRSSLPKIRQHKKPKAALRNPRGNSIIAANWDNSATLSQNYRRLGIASKLNSRAGGVERRVGSLPEAGDSLLLGTIAAKSKGAAEVKVERDPVTGAILKIIRDPREKSNPLRDPFRDLDTDSEDEEEPGNEMEQSDSTTVVRQLEDQAKLVAPRRPRQQSHREKDWIAKLVEKYGEDYSRMARDRKLNPMQQTEADIRKRAVTWKNTQN